MDTIRKLLNKYPTKTVLVQEENRLVNVYY